MQIVGIVRLVENIPVSSFSLRLLFLLVLLLLQGAKLSNMP
jgi:hypothetical protein